MIKPHSFYETPSKILKNMKYYPWFKDCVGAIDGRHIIAVVRTEKTVPYRSRQKKMSARRMSWLFVLSTRFTWIWLEWKGSAHDFHIYTEATTRSNTNFPHLPQGIHSPSITYLYNLSQLYIVVVTNSFYLSGKYYQLCSCC